MSGRILSLQRQTRELGRLRTGYVDERRPVRSETWIVTSHAEHYVQAAADVWGGKVEKWEPQGGGASQWRVRTESVVLDAILPAGDPLSQSYELWAGAGNQRRCDGITEMQSDSPCICRAKFGEEFHTQPKGTVCAPTTRLNVFLPNMPDVGVWRAETHSFYAAQEIAGAVDLIKSAVGQDTVVPIRLRIEQRMRKSNGQTKKYPVIVVELRGITTGQVLGGTVLGAIETPRALDTAVPLALEAPKTEAEQISIAVLEARDAVRDKLQAIAEHGSDADLPTLRAMWPEIKAVRLEAMATEIAETLAREGDQDAARDQRRHVDAEANIGQSEEQLWTRIIQSAPESMGMSELEEDFEKEIGVKVEDADAEQLMQYLAQLGGVA